MQCGQRKSVRGGFSRREVWRNDTLCDDCAVTTVPVTFHATWTERIPTEEANALGRGDVLETAEIEWDRLTVTQVEEDRGSYGRAGTAKIGVWLTDQRWHETESRPATSEEEAERRSEQATLPGNAEPPWPGQVFRDRATGRELMRETTAVIPVKVGSTMTVKGRKYTVGAVEGDEVLLDRT